VDGALTVGHSALTELLASVGGGPIQDPDPEISAHPQLHDPLQGVELGRIVLVGGIEVPPSHMADPWKK